MTMKDLISLRFCKYSSTPTAEDQSKSEAGMTIIEILIVIALLGTIMTIVMTNILDKSDDAKADLTAVQQKKIAESLHLYKVDNGKIPTTEEGLKALVEKPSSANRWRGPYVEAEKINDPWGNEIQYERLAANKFKLTSRGLDGELETADDISFPESSKEDGPVTFELHVPVEENK